MIVHQIVQRSADWFVLRAGKLTGSVAKDMLATIKSGEAAARRDLRYKLIAERLTGISQENGYTNDAMQWGIDHEAEALAAYEAATGSLVETVGFCEVEGMHAGTSPDGFVGDDGILSVKCPKTATHIRYLREGTEPTEHAAQNSHELWVTGRKWIDFVSYDPRLPENLRLFKVRVTRVDVELDHYERKALVFLAEVNTELISLQTGANLRGQLQASL